jgi:peroxiredoxin
MDDRAGAFAAAAGLDGTLNERLASYWKASERALPEFTAAYDRLIARLQAVERGEIGPAIGAPMPDFLLPDQDGGMAALDALLRDGPLVVSFNRGHWCPYCRLDFRALAQAQPEIERLGARIVSIMPDRAQFARQAMADDGIAFPILSDIDLAYALSLDLVYWVGPEIRALYDQLGLDLERYQGNGNYLLPMAAKFIVGRDGTVKARQVDVEFRRRMEPGAIVATLKSLADGR